MAEHPHPPNMPGGGNGFHPHSGHPWGAGSSPWMHYHHAYNTHWRGYGCGRAKGRFLFFVLGAGAATLFFKWRRHAEECTGNAHGGWGRHQRREGGVIEGRDDSAVASSRVEPDERPKWSHKGWAWREEYRRVTPPVNDPPSVSGPASVSGPPPAPATTPAVPALDKTPRPADNNGRAGQDNTIPWKWDQDAMVRSATGTVVDLTESSLDSLIATINGLKLKLKAAEARAADAEKQRKQAQNEASDRKLV